MKQVSHVKSGKRTYEIGVSDSGDIQEDWKLGTTLWLKDEKVDEFLQAIVEVCRKHGYSLSHEDTQGGFIVEKYNEANIEWLMDAVVGKDVKVTDLS